MPAALFVLEKPPAALLFAAIAPRVPAVVVTTPVPLRAPRRLAIPVAILARAPLGFGPQLGLAITPEPPGALLFLLAPPQPLGAGRELLAMLAVPVIGPLAAILEPPPLAIVQMDMARKTARSPPNMIIVIVIMV